MPGRNNLAILYIYFVVCIILYTYNQIYNYYICLTLYSIIMQVNKEEIPGISDVFSSVVKKDFKSK